MPIVVVGLNHRSAPIDLLERLSLSSERIPGALQTLVSYDHVLGCVVLSTCNRVELYADVTAIDDGMSDLRDFLASISHVRHEDIVGSLYSYGDEAAVQHLFRVTAGLDSLLVGETEILGQVKRAYRAAVEQGTVQRLDHVFRRALSLGKRARTVPGITRRPASTSSATVELVTTTLSERSGGDRRTVIVGAGSLGSAIARNLHGNGVTDLVIVNRSEAAGEELARKLGARFLPLSRLEEAVDGAAAVICSTGAGRAIVDRELLERATSRRDPSSPLLVIDLGVPRNVSPQARDVSGVQLCHLRELWQFVPSGMSGHSEHVTGVEDMISGEVERYLEGEQARYVSPTLGALVARAETIREGELDRFLARTDDLTQQQVGAIEQLSRRIVAKMLHSPLVTAKRAAGSNGEGYVEVIRELFGLDEEPSPVTA